MENPRNTRAEETNNCRMRKEFFSAKTRNDHCHFVNARENFFLNRVVNYWNPISNDVLNIPSVNGFKAELDRRN